MRAFIYQDHDAHIAAHTAFMQDPMVAQVIGQNPQAQQIMASLQAHLAEHLGFNYRKQIEEKLGAPLPPPGETLPQDVEVYLAQLVADAGKQLTESHKQEAAQRQAQQQAQDPILQLRQQETAIKQSEVQRKAQKDAADLQVRMAEQQRKTKADRTDALLAAKKLELEAASVAIDAKQAGVKEQISSDTLNLEIFKAATTPIKRQ
jgi:hypothetical protein